MGFVSSPLIRFKAIRRPTQVTSCIAHIGAADYSVPTVHETAPVYSFDSEQATAKTGPQRLQTELVGIAEFDYKLDLIDAWMFKWGIGERKGPDSILSRLESQNPGADGGQKVGMESVKPIKVVFSDIDGTLVHYPKDFESYAEIIKEEDQKAVIRYKINGEERECRVMSSLTGGKAYISERTVELIEKIRSEGTRFALITGARSSTYGNRRTSLPEVDFEIFENGGRCVHNGTVDVAWTQSYASLIGDTTEVTTIFPNMPDPKGREEPLWQLYNRLEQEGWVLDARDYVTNFRIDVTKSEGKTMEDFEVLRKELPSLGLTTSFNLGKADIYPETSGKANAAKRVLKILGLQSSDSVSMFDDDNDVELGDLTQRAFLPGVTHENVTKALETHPLWKLSKDEGFLGTEEALESILSVINSAKKLEIAKPSLVAV